MARTQSGMTSSENGRIAASIVREEDLQDLEKLLGELRDRVDQARADGRIYLMSHYVRLVALVSPEVDRIQRRFKRENLAYFRKEHKRLRLEAKEAAAEQETA